MRLLLLLFLFVGSLQAQVSTQELNVTDSEGRKQGKWMKYYPDSDVKRYEGQFKDDKPIGRFTYFYEDGTVQTTLDYREGNHASARIYFPDGSLMGIGVYVDQQKDSTWTYYSIYGEKVAVEYYVEGKKYGNCKKFHRNGQLLEERYFENDLENGPMKQYYENGELSRVATYVNGSIEGPSAFYHDNGVVRFEGEYFKDTKNGIWKTYDKSGKLIDERKYVKGVPEYRDSDLVKEDPSNYYRKDVLTEQDFLEEDYMAIPDEDPKKKKKKK